jgi:heterodisulfide reductase subunit B2
MSYTYFPGCTLSTKASGYDVSGRAAAKALDMAFEDLAEWQCCGATFPLATDNSMAMIAPSRMLAQAEKSGGEVTTLCAVCFHVLRRTQHFLNQKPEMLERINWFTEEPYAGTARVTHFLELLRDRLTFPVLKEKVVRPLTGLKAAPYYGCLLLRPQEEIGLDDAEQPKILHDCLEALGCEVVSFPYQVECCGSYLAVSKPEVPEALSAEILASARQSGADLIVTACPLCQYNLDYAQRPDAGLEGERLPVVYFTQMMAAALDLDESTWGMQDHYVDPREILSVKI